MSFATCARVDIILLAERAAPIQCGRRSHDNKRFITVFPGAMSTILYKDV